MLFVGAYVAAFRSALPQRIQKIFFTLLLISPTLIACQREIFSEALAVPLSLFLIYFFSMAIDRNNSYKKSNGAMVACGICWACMILTKSYLYYLSFCFLILAIMTLFSKKSLPVMKNARKALVVMALSAVIAQNAWDYRNFVQLKGDVGIMRKAIAIIGKVDRLDRADLFNHLGVALAASVGTNFCNRRYSEIQCQPFNYHGCDMIGISVWNEYVAKYPNTKAAMDAVTHDMIKLYFKKPLVQITGTLLEIIRMLFFEATEAFDRVPLILKPLVPLWHALGSLIFLFFVVIGISLYFKKSKSWILENPAQWTLYLFTLIFIFYHFAVMSEFTNVARYIFPILPFIYLWVTQGIFDFMDYIKGRKI
jgi:hypothetical protein